MNAVFNSRQSPTIDVLLPLVLAYCRIIFIIFVVFCINFRPYDVHTVNELLKHGFIVIYKAGNDEGRLVITRTLTDD